jgi:hypothetical protein
MEVTKWLKPSVKRVTKYGDSASVQAVTRVNAEQDSMVHVKALVSRSGSNAVLWV